MSLMLDALKRIEAKKPYRPATVARAAVQPGESWAAEDAPAASLALLDADSIDDSNEASSQEIDFNGPQSLDAAMSDLAELIAAARQLDRPAPESTPAPADVYREEFDDSARYDPPAAVYAEVAADSNYAASEQAREHLVSDAENDLWQEAFQLNCDLPAALDPLRQYLAEAQSPDFTLPAALPAAADAATIAVTEMPLEAEQPDEQTIEPRLKDESSVPFAEPSVIEPVGSDPYAAAAWQIVRQLPQGRSQVVLVTSPTDGHGKTITLARLVPHLARNFAGNVLVVDANPRNPEMARWLDVAVTWRLPDVLAGATDWMNAVRPTALPRVSLLPGGSDASQRPNVQAAARLFRALAARYDLVLVDSTSLAHSGAVRLAGICDATYLVVRVGDGGRRIVRESARVIDRAGGRFAGCIAIDAGA